MEECHRKRPKKQYTPREHQQLAKGCYDIDITGLEIEEHDKHRATSFIELVREAAF